VKLLQRICGDECAAGSRVPFSLADTRLLRALFRAAGVPSITIRTHMGKAQFPSIRAWIHAHLMGRTLPANVEHRLYTRLLDEAERELAAFVAIDGSASFETPAHVIVTRKRLPRPQDE